MKKNFRNKLTSICRETAKQLDMARNGPRWNCEVTDLKIRRDGRKQYSFYIMDKNSGHEYQATALIDNEQNADWNVKEVSPK